MSPQAICRNPVFRLPIVNYLEFHP
jgi:hypothetical protein